MTLRNKVLKHMGPGAHPGGSLQSVHGQRKASTMDAREALVMAENAHQAAINIWVSSGYTDGWEDVVRTRAAKLSARKVFDASVDKRR